MNDARERMEQLVAPLNHDERRELASVMYGELPPFKKAVAEFLAGLDANDKDRLKNVLVQAFEQYVTELPGPNQFVKSKLRPGVATAAENAVNDWCSWEK